MIEIDITDEGVQKALDRLFKSVEDVRPVLAEIGEVLVESTKERFATSTGPDGQRWASNSQVTILRYLGVYGGSFGKNGRITEKGAGRAMSKRPLIGETRDLSRQINYSIDSENTLSIGSPMIYAAVQQFGARKHEFQGKSPWGAIPARPFLGLSDADTGNILQIIASYLTNPAGS